MLIKNKQLTKQQLHDVEQLRSICATVDGNAIPIHGHILVHNRCVPRNALFYHEQKLVGFASLYFFYDDACELALMVSPEHRMQGVVKQLLQILLPIITAKNLHRVFVSSPKGLNHSWFLQQGFVYHNSEYHMQWHEPGMILVPDSKINIRNATLDDVAVLAEIDTACFESSATNMLLRFRDLFQHPQYTLFVGVKDGEIIAKAHIHQQANVARLLDIAVLPQHQKMGYGRSLIVHCIKQAVAAKSSCIVLEVESANEHALKLYVDLGFKVINACDYWVSSAESSL